MKPSREPRRQTIPVFLLVRTAFQLLWQQRDDALRLGLVPTLLLFGGFLYGSDALVAFFSLMAGGIPTELPPGISGPILILCLIVLVAVCLLTVNWLRFLLLGPMGAVGVGLSIGAAHVRFLFAAIAFMLMTMAAAVILSLPLAFLPGALAMLGNLLVLAAVLVLAARILPFLIGRAIGQSMTLAQAWNVSRGNGVPLAVSLVLVQVPFMVGLAVLEFVLGTVGFTAMAPVGTTFIFSVIQVAVWLCSAGVMATAYRHMVGVRV
jgi:hypothetical protein